MWPDLHGDKKRRIYYKCKFKKAVIHVKQFPMSQLCIIKMLIDWKVVTTIRFIVKKIAVGI